MGGGGLYFGNVSAAPSFLVSKIEEKTLAGGKEIVVGFPALTTIPLVPVSFKWVGNQLAGAQLAILDPITKNPIPALSSSCGASYYATSFVNGTVLGLVPIFATDGSFEVAILDANSKILQKFSFKAALAAGESQAVNLQNSFIVGLDKIAIKSGATSDFDSDGVSDAEELAANTNPWQKGFAASEVTFTQAEENGLPSAKLVLPLGMSVSRLTCKIGYCDGKHRLQNKKSLANS